MITVKRLTQPPKLSWLLWDTAMPDLQIAAHLAPQHYEQAVKDDKVAEVVRDALRVGEVKLMDFQRQLSDL